MWKRSVLAIGVTGLLMSSVAAGQSCSWQPLSEINNLMGTVLCAKVFDEDGAGPKPPALYIGGSFTGFLGGEMVSRVARWDGTNWSNMAGGMSSTVYDFAIFDDDGDGPNPESLYAVGHFVNAGAFQVNRIAKWNASSEAWQGLYSTLGVPGVNSTIRCVTVYDRDGSGPASPQLVVGGAMSSAGGFIVDRIAVWGWVEDQLTWSSWPNTDVEGGDVYALQSFDDDGAGSAPPKLYAAGAFNRVTVFASHVARWSPQTQGWSKLGFISGFDGVNGLARTLAVYDDGGGEQLYVGGSFDRAGTLSNVGNIARWDGFDWTAVGTSPDYGTDAIVNEIGVFDRDGSGPEMEMVHAVGSFTEAGGVVASRVAQTNGAEWFGLEPGFDDQMQALVWTDAPNLAGPIVYAFGASGSFVYGARYFCPEPGDLNADGVLDGADALLMAGCMSGPNVYEVPDGCSETLFEDADYEGDGDLDLADLARFQRFY